MKRIFGVGVAVIMMAGCLDEAEQANGDDEGQTSQALTGNERVRVIEISNGTVMSATESAPNSPFFSAWGPLGGTGLRRLIVDKNADGRLMLFAIGGDGQLYGRYQVQVGGNWNPEGWGPMGGTNVQQLVTARNQDGRLEIFARFADGHAYHRWQVTPNGGWSTGWAPFDGSDLRDLSVVLRPDQRLEVVAAGGDGHVYERIQTAPNSGWLDWSLVGGDNLTHVVAVRNANNRVELIARDANGGIQDFLEGLSASFTSIGGHDLQQPLVGTNGDGRLEVFAIGSDRNVYTISQTNLGGAWGAWQLLGGGSAARLSTANTADGRLMLFATRQLPATSDWIVQSTTQVSGGWSAWTTPGASDQTPMIWDVVAIAQPQ